MSFCFQGFSFLASSLLPQSERKCFNVLFDQIQQNLNQHQSTVVCVSHLWQFKRDQGWLVSFWGVPSHWHVAGSSETTKLGTWAESATQSVKVWRRGLMEEMGNGINPIRPKAKTSLLQTCQNRFASNLHVNHGSAWAETSTAASEKRNMERKRKRERQAERDQPTNQPSN